MAAVVRPEGNSGPTAAVLWSPGAGGTQQNGSARQYICINITAARLNTYCNYMYCTCNLNFTFQGTQISLTVLFLNNKTQFSEIHEQPILYVQFLFFFKIYSDR